MATTPPSLLGMDRKMAYNQRKYHSGWMWAGVTSGLAGMKFSGSPSKFGKKSVVAARVPRRSVNPTKSLVE